MDRDSLFWAGVAAVWCASVVWGTSKAQEAITLDTSRSQGPSVSYTLPSGASCSESTGDRPSLWAGGRIRNVQDAKTTPGLLGDPAAAAVGATIVNSTIFDAVAGNSVGVGIHLPFGGAPVGSCRQFARLAELELLAGLVERLRTAGAITPEDARRLLLTRLTGLAAHLTRPPGGRR